jgi:hypothetical protein
MSECATLPVNRNISLDRLFIDLAILQRHHLLFAFVQPR